MVGTDGETVPYLYYQESSEGNPPRIAVASMPASQSAYYELDNWIQPIVDDTTNFKRKGCSWEVIVPGGYTCWEDDTGEYGCTYHHPVEQWTCDNGGGNTDPGYNWPTDPGGGGPGGNEEDTCDPNAILQTPECEEPIEIILDPLFEANPCLMSVYNQAGEAPAYQSILQNFDGSFSVANLLLSVDNSLPNYTNARTYPPQNYNIRIAFNSNNLDRPSLSNARTMMHEMIHAEMFRKLLSVAQAPDLNYPGYTLQHWRDFVTSLRNDFPGLYDYYMRYTWNVPEGQEPSSSQHEQMAQHYRAKIEDALREFESNHSEDIYNALSWTGLKNTVAWNNLSYQERTQIGNTQNNFLLSNTNCQ
ncbi:hypothetical protein [Gracilimonas sp.]|uniref:hypothetical protein n=1 Tax=Gracilimonas sp. TaxID=1974203 RepID=UPI0032EC2A4B